MFCDQDSRQGPPRLQRQSLLSRVFVCPRMISTIFKMSMHCSNKNSYKSPLPPPSSTSDHYSPSTRRDRGTYDMHPDSAYFPHAPGILLTDPHRQRCRHSGKQSPSSAARTAKQRFLSNGVLNPSTSLASTSYRSRASAAYSRQRSSTLQRTMMLRAWYTRFRRGG